MPMLGHVEKADHVEDRLLQYLSLEIETIEYVSFSIATSVS